MKRIVPVWPMIIAEAGLGVLFYSIFPYLISKYNYVELLVVFIFLSTVLVSVHLVVIAKQKKLPNMQIFKKNVSKNIEFLSKILFSAVILLGYLVLFLSLYRIYPPTLIPVFLFLLVSSVVLSKLWEGLLPIEMFLTLTMLSITPVLLITQSCMATLSATLPEFVERAAHGILLGMFDKTNSQLIGTVSGLQLNQKDLEKIGTQNHWANTWDGITDSGQLHHHSPKGNCLVLVAISVVGKPDTTQAITASCAPHSLETVVKYCESGSDPVLSFHAKPKAGLASGATVYRVLPEGRTADWQACGYSVVMQYPPLSQTPTINTESSKGTQLLEAAFVFAHQQQIAQVFAFSRPSGLRQFLEEK